MRILFDIHGVASYPGFSEIANQAYGLGHRVSFWTLGDAKVEIPNLWGMELGHLTHSMIDGELTKVLLQRIAAQDRKYLSYFLRHMGNEVSSQAIDRLLEKGARWINFMRGKDLKNASKVIKYPLILGDEPILLVESDRNSWMNEGHGFSLDTSTNPQEFYREIVVKTKIGIIMVPEHPQVWDGPRLKVKPEEVMIGLSKQILGWKGRPFFKNLGEELSVYKERSYSHPEKGY